VFAFARALTQLNHFLGFGIGSYFGSVHSTQVYLGLVLIYLDFQFFKLFIDFSLLSLFLLLFGLYYFFDDHLFFFCLSWLLTLVCLGLCLLLLFALTFFFFSTNSRLFCFFFFS
jgi:hypothetical protein